MNNKIQVKYFDTIDNIDKSEWNSIIDPNHVLNSYDYLKAIEYSKINNFKFRYFMFYTESSLIAHVQVGVLTFGLDAITSPGLKKIFNLIKKIYPSFLQITLIESGFVTALGNSIFISDNKYINEILEAYDKELIKLAKKEKTTLILIRDIYAKEKENYDLLFNYNYKIFHNLPNTFLRIKYKDFNDYLYNLNSKRRHEVKKRMKVFDSGGCKVEKIIDFASLSEQLVELWHKTYQHSKEFQREILNENYFKYLSENLKERSFILLCKKDNIPIGFTMFIDSGETLISTYCGINYDYNKLYYTYFILYYSSIDEAIKLKKKWLELGITNYNPKIEIGAIPEPLYVYGKSINPILNLFFIPLLRMTNISLKFHKRKIFNSRHFFRYDTGDELSILIKNEKYKVIDISYRGLAFIYKDSSIKEKKILIKIINKDDFEILAYTKIIYRKLLEDNRCRIGLKIIKMDNEFIIHWGNLVNKFKALLEK